MGKSFRTEKPRVAAERRLERDADGKIVLPRIVTRRPPAGDHHPLTAGMIRGLMRREIPPEYLYGLSRIELRPRPVDAIGLPFGCYLVEEKAILLYSLPMAWIWYERPREALLASMVRFYAELSESPRGLLVTWPGPEVLGLWYFFNVLAHELGHHYRNQYKIRRGTMQSRRHEEFVAELHSARFYDAFVKQARKGRAARPAALKRLTESGAEAQHSEKASVIL